MINSIQKVNNVVDAFLKRHDKTRPVILYGAGFALPHLIDKLSNWGLNIVGICDKNQEKHGNQIKGQTVAPLEQLSHKYPDALYVITSTQFFWEIKQELEKSLPQGAVCEIDFECSHYFIGSKLQQLVLDNNKLVEAIHDKLDDDVSKETYCAALLAHASGKKQDFEQAYTGNDDWYSFNSLIKPKPHGVFVDCGAFDGDTVELYAKAANYQYDHIYAIEPLPSVYEQLEKRIAQQSISRVTLIREGVADTKGSLRFISNGMYSTVTDTELTQVDGKDVVEVSVSKLDDKFSDIKIDTLKMDIEGAEYNALLGAEKLIKRDKPDLAICLYHCAEDFIRIPKLLMEWVPEYHFYIRHQSKGCTDTILFASLEDKS